MAATAANVKAFVAEAEKKYKYNSGFAISVQTELPFFSVIFHSLFFTPRIMERLLRDRSATLCVCVGNQKKNILYGHVNQLCQHVLFSVFSLESSFIIIITIIK